ncbi:uncharacterized protein V1516DRAFT_679113 [Lipomyces oligophaga]|uniref:uncharacterized protein n=1 Tax=Lipomyces oligophaga TaxID=45792 RepID=UPI0034CF9D7F
MELVEEKTDFGEMFRALPTSLPEICIGGSKPRSTLIYPCTSALNNFDQSSIAINIELVLNTMSSSSSSSSLAADFSSLQAIKIPGPKLVRRKPVPVIVPRPYDDGSGQLNPKKRGQRLHNEPTTDSSNEKRQALYIHTPTHQPSIHRGNPIHRHLFAEEYSAPPNVPECRKEYIVSAKKRREVSRRHASSPIVNGELLPEKRSASSIYPNLTPIDSVSPSRPSSRPSSADRLCSANQISGSLLSAASSKILFLHRKDKFNLNDALYGSIGKDPHVVQEEQELRMSKTPDRPRSTSERSQGHRHHLPTAAMFKAPIWLEDQQREVDTSPRDDIVAVRKRAISCQNNSPPIFLSVPDKMEDFKNQDHNEYTSDQFDASSAEYGRLNRQLPRELEVDESEQEHDSEIFSLESLVLSRLADQGAPKRNMLQFRSRRQHPLNEDLQSDANSNRSNLWRKLGTLINSRTLADLSNSNRQLEYKPLQESSLEKVDSVIDGENKAPVRRIGESFVSACNQAGQPFRLLVIPPEFVYFLVTLIFLPSSRSSSLTSGDRDQQDSDQDEQRKAFRASAVDLTVILEIMVLVYFIRVGCITLQYVLTLVSMICYPIVAILRVISRGLFI